MLVPAVATNELIYADNNSNKMLHILFWKPLIRRLNSTALCLPL